MLNPKFVSSHWLALKRKARNKVERADQKANQVKNFGVVQTQKHTGNSTTLKNNEAFPIKKHTPIDSHPSIWILVVSFLWKEISPGPLTSGKVSLWGHWTQKTLKAVLLPRNQFLKLPHASGWFLQLYSWIYQLLHEESPWHCLKWVCWAVCQGRRQPPCHPPKSISTQLQTADSLLFSHCRTPSTTGPSGKSSAASYPFPSSKYALDQVDILPPVEGTEACLFSEESDNSFSLNMAIVDFPYLWSSSTFLRTLMPYN